MATETENVQEQLKEILPDLIDKKELMEKTGKTVEELKKEIQSLKGNFEKLEKNQIIAGKRLGDVKATGLDDESKVDFAKLLIGISKKEENIIKTVQDKYGIKAMDTSTGSAGYAIPEMFTREIVKFLPEESIISAQARRIPITQGNTMPILSATNNITVSHVAENSTATNADVVINKDSVDTQEMSTVSKFSRKLLNSEDVGIVDLVIEFISEAMGQFIDTQGFTGDGTGTNFTGILSATGVNNLIMNSGDTAFSNISFDYLNKMVYQLKKAERRNAKFYLEASIINLLASIQDSTGRPIWEPVKNGVPQTIFGYEYEEVPVMPDITQSGVSTSFVIFGNLKNVNFGVKNQMNIDINKYLYQETGQIGLFTWQDYAVATALPAGFVKLTTAAS